MKPTGETIRPVRARELVALAAVTGRKYVTSLEIERLEVIAQIGRDLEKDKA